jgi:hypothetical protein
MMTKINVCKRNRYEEYRVHGTYEYLEIKHENCNGKSRVIVGWWMDYQWWQLSLPHLSTIPYEDSLPLKTL